MSTSIDPLEESNVWVDEVYNPLAPGMSTAITETPKYMQLSADPLGMPGGARQSKRKPSQANLEKLFPNSKLQSDYVNVVYLTLFNELIV